MVLNVSKWIYVREEMEIEEPKDVAPNKVVDPVEEAAQTYSCSTSLIKKVIFGTIVNDT